MARRRKQIRVKWGKLTEDLLEGKIKQPYGFATDHVRKEVDDWIRCSSVFFKLLSASIRGGVHSEECAL